jgi:DNA repair protein RadC
VDLSQNFLSAFGTLENLNQETGTEMCQIKPLVRQGGTNQSPVGRRKAHGFKAYRSKDQTKIQSGVCRKVFSFSKKIVKLVLLETKLQLIKDLTISKGSLNVSIV